jgi:hypothetical protein
MATTPTITDAGALAVRPPRVNIFAKPNARQGQTDPARQPRGIFDDTAACHSTDAVNDRHAAPSAHRSGGLGRARAGRRLAYLVPVAAAVASLIVVWCSPRSHSTAPAPAASPVHQQPRPHAPHGTERRPARQRVAKHRSQRTQHNAHRFARSTAAKRRGRRLTQPAPTPSVGRLASPRPSPHVAVPARPLPTRVAPDAPPEFM